jgi:hypothetical protein
MNIHAVICTRSRDDVSETTDKLIRFLCDCKIGVYLVADAKSIFSAYQGAFEKIDPDPEDIIIFCHDDIEIWDDPRYFVQKLIETTALPETGFVGPAGTTCLGADAVWWDQDRWQQGKHRGQVQHLDKKQGKQWTTHYGDAGDVVVLDGLFLAARARVVKDIGLEKPEDFVGEWDFYDIHYTSKAFLKGYTNKVILLKVLHNSLGELVGRESWHMNRAAFIAKNEFPMEIKP